MKQDGLGGVKISRSPTLLINQDYSDLHNSLVVKDLLHHTGLINGWYMICHKPKTVQIMSNCNVAKALRA